MTDYADLEIGLHRRDADAFGIQMRFSQPNSDSDTNLLPGSPTAGFDFKALEEQALDDSRYGQALFESLFKDPDVKSAFKQARDNARSMDAPMRMRLFIWSGASDLHALRWETLRDPEEDAPLLAGERLFFSRYLSSFDWRPARLLARSDLTALAVIANPSNLSEYNLAPVDVEGELERAKAGLEGIRVTMLAGEEKPSLNGISAKLREGCDVLHLVCHGALIKGEPQLWLEDEAGNVARTPGVELVNRIKELRKVPRLVVLASCQSAGGEEAGAGDGGALAALGPRLGEAGIPAVLAMQGNITMETVATFMPVFFKELQRDGQIDRAMAVARGAVRDRPDWWMPVLFMRLKGGRLWYTAGFTGDKQGSGADKWPSLIDSIIEEECTPIVGPELAEPMFNSRYEIARKLAENHHFPMAPHDRENLPRVAQYISIHQSPKSLLRRCLQNLYEEMRSRYENTLPEDILAPLPGKPPVKKIVAGLEKLTGSIADQSRPHQVLAGLSCPIYITTDPTSLLFRALESAGKNPRMALCPWNAYAEKFPSADREEPGYRPDADNPFIYHLFGHIREPRSLVLTEDNFFDYLIGVTGNKELIPKYVRAALANSALMFLGFRMNDWNFRVLFRSIMNQEGSTQLDDFAHVAVQITPEEGRILEPERARRYLETYFQKSASINIYWGGAEDFIEELNEKWEET